jgi:hypothetical protein
MPASALDTHVIIGAEVFEASGVEGFHRGISGLTRSADVAELFSVGKGET